jgi:hypothetical protein
VYAAKVHGGNADNPTFQQAMNGPDSVEYLKAMKLEVDTLVGQRTWECVPRKKGMNVLKGTWAFKLKRLPDGTAYRHKARFCARGDLQKEGIEFFENIRACGAVVYNSVVIVHGTYRRMDDQSRSTIQTPSRRQISRRKFMSNIPDSLDPRLVETKCCTY